MTYNSTYRLVRRPYGLLPVPLLGCNLLELVEGAIIAYPIDVLLLQLYALVLDGRVGHSHHENSPAELIREVNSLGDLPPADGEHDCTPTCSRLLLELEVYVLHLIGDGGFPET